MAVTRSRKWVLCINPSAICYDDVQNIVKSQNKCRWAYIVHTMDTNEDGTPKLRHFHVCLEYDNARDFTSIQKMFPGAHIEKPICWSKAVQYLCHKNDEKKYQYSLSAINTNDYGYFSTIYNNEYSTVTRFDFNNMRDYIIQYESKYSGTPFIYFLTYIFPLDRLKIIKQRKQIEEYVNLICENDETLLDDIDKELIEMLF